MTDLTIPKFLKRGQKHDTVDISLSNIPSVPQDPAKAPKPRQSKLPVKTSSAPPKPKAPAKRAPSKVADLATARAAKAKIADGPAGLTKAIQRSARGVKSTAIDTAATVEAGHLPIPPELKANASKQFMKHRSELIALAKAKDVAGLRDYKMNADRVALQTYRQGCIKALSK